MSSDHDTLTATAVLRPLAPIENPLQPKRRRVHQSPSITNRQAGPRPSQRAPKSCLECTRRKIRCDKEQPCGACSERGEAGECRREAVFVKGAIVGGELSHKATTLESLARELQELRQRVAQLEQTGQGSATPGSNGARDPLSRSQPVSDLDQSNLPGTMEEMALGIGESTRWKGSSLLNNRDQGTTSATQWYQPITFESSLAALPSRPNSRLLVAFYLEEVSWNACAVHGPTFLADHEAFWQRLERSQLQDDLWMALLLAVLSVAAFFMDENQAALRGFSFQHLRWVGATWFDSAIAVMYRCGIWTRSSLLTCQILQVLSPAFHLTGNTSLHQNLTGVGVTQLRAINLHLLGSHKEDSPHETISKEVGRRIWWNNVEIDWTFLPYNRYVQFPPHQFTTQMPEMTDETAAISDGSLSIQYRTACFKSARCIYDVYGHLGLGDDPTYERVLTASRALDQLVATLPTELQFHRDHRLSSGLFTVESTRQRLLALMLAYRSYQLHRLFFVRSLTDPKYGPSRTACLQAADTITSVADRGLPRVYFQLWNVTVSLVAAGIVLAIHLLEAVRSGEPSLATQRLKIQSLIERLKTSDDRSGIADRGATFIAYLLRVQEEISAGTRTEVQFTRESMLALVQTGLQITQPPPSSPSPETAPSIFPPTQGVDQTVDPFTIAHDETYGMGPFTHGEIDFAALLNDFVSDS